MKSWSGIRRELPPDPGHTRLQEAPSRPLGLTADEFIALRALEDERVLFTFSEGQSFPKGKLLLLCRYLLNIIG